MNNGLNFKVCPLQSQRNLTLFYPCVWGSLDEIISKLFPMFPEKHIAPVCGPFYCRTQAQMRASARGCHLPQTPQLRGAAPPPVRVPDESKASFLIPPCWLAPFLPPYDSIFTCFRLSHHLSSQARDAGCCSFSHSLCLSLQLEKMFPWALRTRVQGILPCSDSDWATWGGCPSVSPGQARGGGDRA